MLIERFLINYVGSGARELFPLEDSFNFYWLLWVPVYLCVCVCVCLCVSVCVCVQICIIWKMALVQFFTNAKLFRIILSG